MFLSRAVQRSLIAAALCAVAVAQPPAPPALACATLCQAVGTGLPDCQQRCMSLLQPQPGTPENPCRNALTELGQNQARAEAMAFSSGHIAEAVGLLLQAANRSAEAVSFIPYINDPGSYDACNAVAGAHYCLASPPAAGSPLPLRLGACLPQECEHSSVNALLNTTDTSAVALTCGGTKYSTSAGGIATLTLFSVLAVLLAVGTALEFTHNNSTSSSSRGGLAETLKMSPVASSTPTVSPVKEQDEEANGLNSNDDESMLAVPLLQSATDTEGQHNSSSSEQQHGDSRVSSDSKALQTAVRLLLCFGLVRNWSSLWSFKRRGDFAVLDGIRTLSMQVSSVHTSEIAVPLVRTL
jgi:hypothetical protein